MEQASPNGQSTPPLHPTRSAKRRLKRRAMESPGEERCLTSPKKPPLSVACPSGPLKKTNKKKGGTSRRPKGMDEDDEGVDGEDGDDNDDVEDDDVVEVARVQAAPRGTVHPIVGPGKVGPVSPGDPQPGPSSQGGGPNPVVNDFGGAQDSEDECFYLSASSDDDNHQSVEEELEALISGQPSRYSFGDQYYASSYRMTHGSILRNKEENATSPTRTRSCPVRYCAFHTRWASRLKQHCVKYHGFDGGNNPDMPVNHCSSANDLNGNAATRGPGQEDRGQPIPLCNGYDCPSTKCKFRGVKKLYEVMAHTKQIIRNLEAEEDDREEAAETTHDDLEV